MSLAVVEATETIAEIKAGIRNIPPSAENAPAPELSLMLEAFQALYIELLLDHPRADTLNSLFREAQQYLGIINLRAAEEISAGHLTSVFGAEENIDKVVRVFEDLSKKIVDAAHRKTLSTLSRAASYSEAIDTPELAGQDTQMTDLTRHEVDAKLAANKAEVDARLASFETSIKTGFAEARTEMAELRADMQKMNAEIKTWTLATMITIIGTMLAAIFGVATIFNNASKSSTPAQVPAQNVYTLPAGSTIVTAPEAPAATVPPPAK